MTNDAQGRYGKVVNAWCLYDWANSAFATTVMAALFPPFFRGVAVSAGLSQATATACWGYTTALALLLIALGAPLLGAVADHTGGKKKFLAGFAFPGALATAAFVTIGRDRWMWAAFLFILANIGFAGANVFYESLLPHIVRPEDLDRVSARGYAAGYLGGGLLLAVNVAWVIWPQRFLMTDTMMAVKACFVSVALWWVFFAIPLLRWVPEPPAEPLSVPAAGPLRSGITRLAATFTEIRRYRQLLLFLIAFWIYNDGIGTIIKMATAYGSEIGIGIKDMTLALIITQFVGIPCTLLFAKLADSIGAKASILLALAVYALICVGGYFMKTAAGFYLLACLVGTVQGGSQSLSRSLYAAMVPPVKSAEFFGFYSTSSKFAGIAGPLLFGALGQLTGNSRVSILLLALFFVLGGICLVQVDVDRGIRESGSPNAGAGRADGD